jgi:excisionase family DNA binding protein
MRKSNPVPDPPRGSVAADIRYLTPPEVAARLGVDVHKVMGWIRRGELRAANVGDGAQRPRFRISPIDLELFLSARAAAPEPKITRMRRKKDPNIIEFF